MSLNETQLEVYDACLNSTTQTLENIISSSSTPFLKGCIYAAIDIILDTPPLSYEQATNIINEILPETKDDVNAEAKAALSELYLLVNQKTADHQFIKFIIDKKLYTSKDGNQEEKLTHSFAKKFKSDLNDWLGHTLFELERNNSATLTFYSNTLRLLKQQQVCASTLSK